MSKNAVSITAAEACCGLGSNLAACTNALQQGRGALRPFGEFCSAAEELADVPAAWIADRRFLRGRRYGLASNAALHVAGGAIRAAKWTPQQCRDAWIFAGTSRGNIAEWQTVNERRPVRQFRASNTLHSEIAAAVSIEFGIRGPWQVLSNGCAAGLDAMGMAWMAVSSGMAPRAIVLAAEFPLVPDVLRAFRQSHVLAEKNSPGICLGEGAAALVLEPNATGPRILGYWANSDAHDALAMPADATALRELFAKAPAPDVLLPHATGTQQCTTAEQSAWPSTALPAWKAKPWIGHILGASGLLEVALALPFLTRQELPPIRPGETQSQPIPTHSTVHKWACSMGGHNALVGFSMD